MTPVEKPSDYSAKELMVISAARMITDRDIVFCGTGISMLAAVAAKHIYAPESVIFFESGAIDSGLDHLPLAVSDSRVMYKASAFCSLTEAFSFMQNKKTGARIVGIIGAAQIDPFGNLNSTMIGDYGDVGTRFPGSGGACDLASFVNTVLVFMKLEKRKFVDRLDYLTSPGWRPNGRSREDAGLRPRGPSAVITDMGILKFEAGTRRMYLDQCFPGVSPEDIQNRVGFDLDVSRAVRAEPPGRRALSILRTQSDPEKLILD
ncbi:MAG: ketoacid-CoA transferase [Desulfobacterales bacterium]|nr:ketoacid-CoA transferase [Desulfobacterales bacterium]